MPSASIPLLIMAGVSASGTIASGEQQKATDDANAKTSFAVSQRASNQDLKDAALVNSRVQAVAAGSGAGATDPTVLNIQGGIAKQGAYNAAMEMFNGQSSAAALKSAGDQAKIAAYTNAAVTLAGSGQTLLDKYGGTLPEWMGGSATKTAQFSVPGG